MKVLVVDDQQINRELLAFMLEDNDFENISAANGQEAVDAVRQDSSIDLILMDINMPVMDGFEATKKIKGIVNERDRIVPVIFVTGLDDEDTLSKCLEIGGDDFVPKPVNETILVAKLMAHQRSILFHRELKSSHQELSYHRGLMDREHAVVENIFKNCMRRLETHCENVSFRSAPASMFNGDMLLVTPSPLGGIYVLLGDFTGHGLAAAIGCLPVTDIFYSMTKKKASVSVIVREINNKLYDLLPDNMFFCATVLELDKSGEHLTIWSGGMNDLLFLDDAGEIARKFSSQHMPLGILPPSEFEEEIDILTNIENLRVYVYTDGIIEAMSPEKELFGEERLQELLKELRENCVPALFEEVEKFQGGGDQTDDITLIELRCCPVKFDDRRDDSTEAGDTVDEELIDDTVGMTLAWNVEVVLNPNELRSHDVVPQIVQILGGIDKARMHKDILFTIVSELYNNALEHGVLKLDSNTKDLDGGFERYYKERGARLENLAVGEIVLRMKVIPGVINRLVVSLTDSGEGFRVKKIVNAEADEDASHARGTHLVQSLCEELVYSNGGRTATATYQLN